MREALGSFCGTLLTDGYIVYDRFVQTVTGVARALEYIEALYGHEARLRQQGLADAAKLAYRGEYAKPVVEAFFLWLRQTLTTQVLLPTNPFT